MPFNYWTGQFNNFNGFTKNLKRDINIKEALINGTIINKKHISTEIYLSNIELKHHQKLVVNKMKFMENDGKLYLTGTKFIKTKVGIYADSGGTGKSISMLARIIQEPILKNSTVESNNINNKCFIFTDVNKSNYIKTNLIIVSHVVIKQWASYITKNTKLTFILIDSSSMFNYIIKNDPQNLNKYNIILISSNFFNTFYTKLHKKVNNDIYFSRIIFDEADTIKIPNCEHINSLFTWYITSSVENLVFLDNINYSIKDAYNFHDIVESGNFFISGNMLNYKKYNGIKHRGSIYNFFKNIYKQRLNFPIEKIILKINNNISEKSFNLPKIIYKTYICNTPSHAYTLEDNISTDLLKSIKEGNVKNIINKFTFNISKNISDFKLQTCEKFELDIIKLLKNENKFAGIETKITKIKSRIDNIKYKIQNINNEKCVICYEKLKEPSMSMECCTNLFHLECLTKNLAITKKSICPLCRCNFDINNCNVLYSGEIQLNNLLNKEEQVIEIIKKSPNKKYIIFLDYNKIFNKIIALLQKLGLKFSEVKGNSNKINTIVKRYKKDLNILFLNSKNYGKGLNLENTTDIIFCNRLDDDIKKSVIVRAQRPGRSVSLNIHYICHKNEQVNF